MIKRSLFFVVLILMTFVLSFAVPKVGSGADTDGKYAVRGVGAAKCSQMVAAIDAKDQNMRKDAVLLYTSWLNGYLSYVNRVEKGTFDIIPLTDGSHLLAVIVGQCRKNPDALVETIAYQVTGILSKAKVSTESPLVTLPVGNQKGIFRKATLVAVQNKLIALGHFKGKADGEFGAGSQQALRAFQKAEKLNETGFPDTDTLMRILLK
ncbi:MAG: peptidoglycan-binding protein [Deltaproteobacteria bacterium]|nr:peptidoglycan-binding protein [Deltaproteobacteria bacterium]